MTGDVRDRILGLLSTGPATVGRLAARLGVPGGVVSYALKLLERDGLVRVGGTRRDRGVPTPVYVSTAAATPPPLPGPPPIPGVTRLAGERYPTPLWTVPQPPPGEAPPTGSGAEPSPGPAGERSGVRSTGREPAGDTAGRPLGPPSPGAPGRAGGGEGTAGPAAPSPRADPPVPPPRRFGPGPARGPRLHEVRRVPMDDATFYEFAERLDALAREFAARATPGAPATELTIQLTRPESAAAGYGS